MLYPLLLDSRFKAKHSLDSDEEDEVKESSLMDEEEIEGQEDSTVVGALGRGRQWSVCPGGRGQLRLTTLAPSSLLCSSC